MTEEIIYIHTEYIQLDQLLKYANVLGTGGQIKVLLEEDMIRLDGQVVKEKRKKIYPSQRVTIGDELELVVQRED